VKKEKKEGKKDKKKEKRKKEYYEDQKTKLQHYKQALEDNFEKMCIPYMSNSENQSFTSNADLEEEVHPMGIGKKQTVNRRPAVQ
jgi:hypothetical protein